mmetsp:Transcript_7744/g.15838  ORF Transcript_7744/g.15838 Transcript_7744/m.15838 type:complete len:536 (-) Transcript_7744:53-1660(-)
MEGIENDQTVGRTNVKGVVMSPTLPVETASRSKSVSSTSSGVARSEVVGASGVINWPTSADLYQLQNKIGQGAFASVWRAKIKTNDGHNEGDETEDDGVYCAIKIMDLEHVNINISDIRLEVQTMRLSSHPNILVCHTSFVRDTDLWLVTQLMNKGSSLHCLQSARAKLLTDAAANANNDPNLIVPQSFTYTSDDSVLEGGLTAYSSLLPPEDLVFEAHITYILYETLLGLKYIHDNGQIHRDIKAGNLLLDKDANVRIADFGVSSWLIDSGNRREHTTTFVGTPCWMAPEVMEQVDGYDYKADIWSLGITALELCKGYAPYAKYAPMKVLLLTIQEDPPSLETYSDGDDTIMWSKSFRSMINLCLQKDPSKRPTCQELLAHRHFKPLATEIGRAEWQRRTEMEVCNVVDDVGNVVGGERSSGNLPGEVPIQIISSTEKDRPAGTSWIFPGGSQVLASTVTGGDADEGDFFDQFEKQTGGENFVRENARQKNSESIAEENNEIDATGQDEDDDDINDFFDEFEKTTGGENFRRDG